MKKQLLCFLLLFSVCISQAQLNRYMVVFRHKGATTHTLSNPAAYLSQRAIDRRALHNIAIDSSDLPVPSSYISAIEAVPNVSILNVSRWLNSVVIRTTDPSALATIAELAFVNNITGIAARPEQNDDAKFREIISTNASSANRVQDIQDDYYNYGTNSFNEIHLHNGEFLHNTGLRGQEMQIAMLDGGFFNYTSLRAFDSVNANGQVLSTWDFVAGHSSVVEDNAHGMQCFSTIAANIPGEFIGKAPKASFHLYRTEDVSSEYPVEEFHWACAAERADSIGADLISSSVGYGYDFSNGVADYPYSNLNGDITISARAADLAARKGLLVFNSAGNSGNDSWQKITTPADADSIVAVGAVNQAGLVGSFSSYGPSADGRIKPDVASLGVNAMVQGTNNSIAFSNGTSFSCPNMAGLAACLWQGFPEVNNMRVIHALKESASRFENPDNRIGYGIPDMKKAFGSLLKEVSSVSAQPEGCNYVVQWISRDVAQMRYVVEVKMPGETGFTPVSSVASIGGASLADAEYTFTVLNNLLLQGNSVACRIGQVIDTASATVTVVYLDTINLVFGDDCNSAAVSANRVFVAANPVNSSSNVIIETTEAVPVLSVRVFDIKGSLVYQIRSSKPAGRSSFPLQTPRLAPGEYVVKVYAGEKTVGKARFVKL